MAIGMEECLMDFKQSYIYILFIQQALLSKATYKCEI